MHRKGEIRKGPFGGEKERRTFPKVESQYVGCFQIGPERVRWALGKYWAYYYLFYFGAVCAVVVVSAICKLSSAMMLICLL